MDVGNKVIEIFFLLYIFCNAITRFQLTVLFQTLQLSLNAVVTNRTQRRTKLELPLTMYFSFKMLPIKLIKYINTKY